MIDGFLDVTAVLIFIGVIALILVSYNAHRNPGENNPVIVPPCSTDPGLLVQIPSDQPHCFENGIETNKFYIGDIDPKLDFVVAPYGTSPIDVCVSFCTNYENGKCVGAEYNGRSAQENFDSCMDTLSSDTCKPPKPLAAQGNIVYYALSPTPITCQSM